MKKKIIAIVSSLSHVLNLIIIMLLCYRLYYCTNESFSISLPILGFWLFAIAFRNRIIFFFFVWHTCTHNFNCFISSCFSFSLSVTYLYFFFLHLYATTTRWYDIEIKWMGELELHHFIHKENCFSYLELSSKVISYTLYFICCFVFINKLWLF